MFDAENKPDENVIDLGPLKAGRKPKPPPAKPRKLISLSYNYSDSDDDETREERKARIVSIFGPIWIDIPYFNLFWGDDDYICL